jgi:ABC-type transport system involved in multi-copper enzyme maturation permease subunit
LLLTTLLTPGRIILAKLLAALRVSTVLTFLLTEQLLLAYVLLPELRFRFWTLVVFLLIIATTCLATSSVGLMCSALVRKTSTAMILTYLTLLLLFVLPMGLSWYLEGLVRDKTVTSEVVVQDKSLTQEQLAAITITSPFSAALSVPMHTSRIENWTGQSLNIQQPPLVPLTSAFALPVWTVFLALYPPLSLLFLGITYLAFRWRWWKAGDSG